MNHFYLTKKNILLGGLAATIVYFLLTAGGTEDARLQEGDLTEKQVQRYKNRLAEEMRAAYSSDAPKSRGVVEVALTAQERSIQIVDHVTTPVMTYSEGGPGQEIRLQYGETLRATFTNNLAYPTTIHWHGVRVPPAMDGVPGISQEPVQPGETFVYEFTPKDAGTFWFHSHVDASEQVERGLYGTLIVEEPELLTQYHRDMTLVVDDWLLEEDGKIYDAFNTRHDLMHDGRWGNVVTVNNQRNFTIDAQPGELLRLRLVNPSNGRVYMPDFSELDATLIAFDGMPTRKPLAAQDIVIAPGNRADFLVQIPNATQQKYVIYDRFTVTDFTLFTIRAQGDTLTQDGEQKMRQQPVPVLQGADVVPVDHEYVLDAQSGGPLGIAWTINGDAYSDAMPTITLAHEQFHKIRFRNVSARIHPMHLHGQFFKVIARNDAAVDEAFLRDTVLVGPGETVDIGLVPRDRGTWVQHCHILEHAEAGMMSKIIVE